MRNLLPSFMGKSKSGSSRSSMEAASTPPSMDFVVPESRWATDMLLECARSISIKDTARMQHFLWMLNELSTPYGDCDQKVAWYFLQAFFAHVTDTGPRCYRTMCTAVEKTQSFDLARKTILKFQELSPWTTFGHVAANGAILEALEGEQSLHIVDLSGTFCTQWPTLLESLATRNDETPRLRLTTVLTGPQDGAAGAKLMSEVGQRMQKFSRLMGVPFEFKALHASQGLDSESLQINPGEALAINCLQSLHQIPVSERDSVLSGFLSMNPKILTLVEDNLDLTSDDFYDKASECVRYFSQYFDSLDESFPRTSNERLLLERACGRTLVNALACHGDPSAGEERREKARQWCHRLRYNGFSQCSFSDDVIDDVRALLKRYKEGWSHVNDPDSCGLFLAWKDQPLIWASAWKPD